MSKQSLFDHSAIDQQTFLASYWHKKPLVLPQAVVGDLLNGLPDAQQLKELSCDEDVQSRVVFKSTETTYEVEYGPFAAEDWDDIKDECWNLLVSDIDKWLPESKKLLSLFPFIRQWLFDDIMLSCGSIGGTVGPHTDQYDVFLLQVKGQRKWHFSSKKTTEPELIHDQPLKLIADYVPDQTIILNPGDVLYIPPQVAHYGIALSGDCVTCSIGTRTPSHAELLTAFVDHMSQNFMEHDRFEEPELSQALPKSQITDDDMQRISQIITKKMTQNTADLSQWFGQFISEYRSLFYEFNHYQQADSYHVHQPLTISPFSKSCYFLKGTKAQLFVDGKYFLCSTDLAQWLCDNHCLSPQQWSTLDKQDQQTVMALFENGSLVQE